jgi:hypothetical protein
MADAVTPTTASIIMTFAAAIWWRYLNRDFRFVPTKPKGKRTDRNPSTKQKHNA